MVLGFVCVGSVDIVCFGEGIFGFGVHTDETGDGVSDLSFECYGDTIDSSGRDSSVRSRVLSGFDSVDVESALYVLESRYSVGITGITGKTCQARESDCPEDHENRDDHDEFHEGETTIFRHTECISGSSFFEIYSGRFFVALRMTSRSIICSFHNK